jgi:hypothetical protein
MFGRVVGNPEVIQKRASGKLNCNLLEEDFWPLDCAPLNFRVARQALTASGGVQSQSLVVASEDARETPRAA